jgi:hypothetical protein
MIDQTTTTTTTTAAAQPGTLASVRPPRSVRSRDRCDLRRRMSSADGTCGAALLRNHDGCRCRFSVDRRSNRCTGLYGRRPAAGFGGGSD